MYLNQTISNVEFNQHSIFTTKILVQQNAIPGLKYASSMLSSNILLFSNKLVKLK